MFTRSSWRAVGAALTVYLLMPSLTLAQSLSEAIVPKNCQGANAAKTCGICDIAQLAQNLINTAIFLAVILSAILFAWAGFKMMVGRDNSAERKAGKDIFFKVIVGLVIILAAWLLVDTLFNMMTGDHLWAQVC